MRKLRLSTTTNLLPREVGKFCENIRANAEMAKRVGFDALDFSFCVPEYTEEGFEKYVECAIGASEDFGIKYEVCHLPFNGKVALDPSIMPELEARIANGIKGARMLGVRYAVVHPNTTTVARGEFDEASSFESVVDHLSRIVNMGEKYGDRKSVV